MPEAVIVDAVRTPIGRYGGVLSTVRPDDLAARVIEAVVERTGLPVEEVDDVDQMLEAQNERRRRRGEPDRTEDDVRADVAAAEREIQERAADYHRGRSEDV